MLLYVPQISYERKGNILLFRCVYMTAEGLKETQRLVGHFAKEFIASAQELQRSRA